MASSESTLRGILREYGLVSGVLGPWDLAPLALAVSDFSLDIIELRLLLQLTLGNC